MPSTKPSADQATAAARGTTPDLKFEVVLIPVADADRSKAFYSSLGWREDADFVFDDDLRVLQFTPPGSEASVIFGKGVEASSAPVEGLVLAVDDVEAARDDLIARGVYVSDLFHYGRGAFTAGERLPGPHPDRGSYFSFATFSDPDGNVWQLQEVKQRLPGRVAGKPSYSSADDLARALKRAEAAHGEYEKKLGQRDDDWPSWYAQYMVAEQSGAELPA